ncbi:MAG: cytochrome P450 [Parasphingopyxis sp.]|uniref:cytochrome P450 n=1 Tax=Parasphingopyxis sp. TaxID=1920299 RepID=UPI0026235F08|nr:cytochrome P450 [uncultured Parasphingopyxis sp.]
MTSRGSADQFGKGLVANGAGHGEMPSAAMPLAEIDPSHPDLFATGTWREIFARLRAEAPVLRVESGPYGPYWSVAGYDPVVQVSSRPEIFSSSFERGGFTIQDMASDAEASVPMFIALDGEAHAHQRRSVAPAFAPSAMAALESDVRRRTGELLDRLPRDEEFDWVDSVSIELTTGMLAILFDFPWDDRRKLTFWSDWMGDTGAATDGAWREQRGRILFEAASYFGKLWAERKGKGAADLISMMAESDVLADADQRQILGNMMLLIVGGNDTTRNSMSGAVDFMTEFPQQREALEGDGDLVANAVSETIRKQSPLPHMRRTAIEDAELGGQAIRAGDKVVLWHISANHDESIFPDAENWDLGRENSRRHIAFGHGVHRCVGARLAELQLRILFEELRERRLRPVRVGEPRRIASNFLHGIQRMRVRLERY